LEDNKINQNIENQNNENQNNENQNNPVIQDSLNKSNNIV